MITLAQILAEIGSKITKPTEGTRGQRLTTNGSGTFTWSGSTSEITGNTLRINGQNYTVRTGTEGAAGYLTIAENAVYLGAQEVSLQLADKAVESIYLGTTLVYTKPGKVLTLFDNGYAGSIAWSGNKLPRPNYTTYGNYSLAHVENDGYMQVYISLPEPASDFEHNAHVCTSSPITVPAKASRLNVSMRNRNSAINVVFGLLPSDCVNTYSTTKGGVLSNRIALSSTDYSTYTIDIPASCRGVSLYPVINGRGVANASRDLLINKVWID